jgi:ABC-type transport system involved in multi-copper enzyme maturation permease subunit
MEWSVSLLPRILRIPRFRLSRAEFTALFSMSTVLAIARVVIKELYRRKDFYVLFVLTAVITLVMGSVSFFHDTKMVRYVKDIALLLIWISALVIAIGTTARQIPAERENRTIFPLLAKPVMRWQVILGKFAGCWLACGMALIVLYLFFAIVSGSREHHWPLLNFCRALWLHWVMLGVVVAFVLLGSVSLSAPSSNATISFIVVLGILFLGRYLNQVALQQPEPLCTVIYAVYYLIPHLEWYDVRDLIIYDQNSVGWLDCGLATLYAALYMAVFLLGTWLVFRRKPLNV